MTLIELFGRLETRRHHLGMTKSEVAKRARIPIATLNRLLSGKEKRPSLDNVRALAGALRIEVHLGATITVSESESAFEVLEEQAKQKAARVVRLVQGTMGLEAQAVGSDDLKAMTEQTKCGLLAGSRRKLWSA